MRPLKIRQDLVTGHSADLTRRRWMVGTSLLAAAAMGTVTLLQTGILKHLPDPPIPGFDSDKVNLSETAYQFGVPDGALGLASFAANLPLIAFGGTDRARRQPLVPLALAAKTGVEAAISAWYFYQMPAKEKAWCGYCIMGAIASIATFALTIPEARQAAQNLRGRGD